MVKERSETVRGTLSIEFDITPDALHEVIKVLGSAGARQVVTLKLGSETMTVERYDPARYVDEVSTADSSGESLTGQFSTRESFMRFFSEHPYLAVGSTRRVVAPGTVNGAWTTLEEHLKDRHLPTSSQVCLCPLQPEISNDQRHGFGIVGVRPGSLVELTRHTPTTNKNDTGLKDIPNMGPVKSALIKTYAHAIEPMFEDKS